MMAVTVSKLPQEAKEPVGGGSPAEVIPFPAVRARSSSTSSAAVSFEAELPLPDNVVPLADESSAVEAEWTRLRDPAFRPSRTDVGAILRRLRRAALASQAKLLSWEEIDSLLDEVRGRWSGR